MNKKSFLEYKLPRFNEIPNVGLYLKQVVTYINEIVNPLLHTEVTTTMLSNYVKLHLVPSPVKKMYNREQIAMLIFIVLSKNVLSLDNIKKSLQIQEETVEMEIAYNYFCDKFEGMLKQVSGEDIVVFPKEETTLPKYLLKHVIITLVQKIHMDYCFMELPKVEEK